MKLNRQVNFVLNQLGNSQAKVEKKVEKLAVQVQKLENKYIKIANISRFKSSGLNINELDQNFSIESFFEKQLELNVNTLPKEGQVSHKNDGPLTWELILKALHFPNDEHDLMGFSALKIARKNNTFSELLQVSEDFLNLIAQDAIYLDDLKIEPPPVEAWLSFISTNQNLNRRRLNCVGIDRQIKRLKSRIKTDTIFRDTSLMLMRRFDVLLRDHLKLANDDQIFKIAETRTGKAFLIVGKLSDSF
jgi:hypothetical protein